MTSVFWDSQSDRMIDYLEQEKTVTAAYYAELIRKLCAAIKKNVGVKLRQGLLLHHDNAPAHALIHCCKWRYLRMRLRTAE